MTAVASVVIDDRIVSHYRVVALMLEKIFGRIPLIWMTFDQSSGAATWHCRYFGHYSELSAEHLVHLSTIGAAEFYSRAPMPNESTHGHFMRLLLEQSTGVTAQQMREAALVLRSVLTEEGTDPVPALDGLGNVTLWVPLCDGPEIHMCLRVLTKSLASQPLDVQILYPRHRTLCTTGASICMCQLMSLGVEASFPTATASVLRESRHRSLGTNSNHTICPLQQSTSSRTASTPSATYSVN